MYCHQSQPTSVLLRLKLESWSNDFETTSNFGPHKELQLIPIRTMNNCFHVTSNPTGGVPVSSNGNCVMPSPNQKIFHLKG